MVVMITILMMTTTRMLMMMTMMMMTTLDRSIRVTVAMETRHSPMFWFRTVLSSHTRLMKSYDRKEAN